MGIIVVVASQYNKEIPMTRKELLRILRDVHRIDLKAHMLEYWIWEHHIPAPELGPNNKRDYRPDHLNAILALLQKRRKAS